MGIHRRLWLWMSLVTLISWENEILVGAFEARVLELSDRFLEFRNEGMWLVKFYAPWCGHCKRLEPIFSHVAQALYDSPIHVAKVDCTKFSSVCSTFSVNGYPTIKFIKAELVHTYQGDRKTDDIVQYARRMSGPAVKDLKGSGSCSDLHCVFMESKVLFAYVGHQEGPLWESFRSTANQYQSTSIFYAFNNDDAPPDWKENHELPFVAVRKEGDEDFFDLPSPGQRHPPGKALKPSERNLTRQLSAWVEKERFPFFVEVSRGNFQSILDTSKFIVMAILEEDKIGRITAEMTEFKAMVQAVAARNKRKYHHILQFGWVGVPSFVNSIAMETLPIPSLLVLNASTFQHHIPDDEPQHLTVDAIETFLESILNQSAPAYGGKSIGTKLYRAYYEGKTGLIDMWNGNPILTVVIFGLPMAFLSLIFYSICCAEFMDASDDEEPLTAHDKRE